MSETPLMRETQVLFSTIGARMFRNNVGSWRDKHGHVIKYGLCNPGGSDLIGWLPITVTQSMVGHRLAIFTAAEIKDGDDKDATEAQRNFLAKVRKAGGFGMLIHTFKEAESLMPPPSPPPLFEPNAED